MEILIKAKNINLTNNLKVLINKKLASLERFGKLKGKCRLEVEKTTEHHLKGSFFKAKAQVVLPGKVIQSEVLAESLTTSLTEMRDELQREVKKYRDKKMTKQKRGAREFKRQTRISEAAKFKKNKGQRILQEGN